MRFKRGQTLVLLLAFMAIAITITTAAVVVLISNSQSASKFALGTEAYDVAESGVENALVRLLRDPSYTGESLTVGQGTATIAVTGTGPYTVTSTGVVSDFSRRIQVTANYTNGVLTVTSWSEVYP